MNATMNNRTRKSLAEQIDRLDGILDGLADGLNEVVTAAVREAVSVAVRETLQAVLTEFVNNPQLVEKLRGQPSSSASDKVRAVIGRGTGTVKKGLVFCTSWLGGQVRACYQICCLGGRQVRRITKAASDRVRLLRQFQVPLLMAIIVGTIAGTAAYFAGPWLVALVGGVGGFAGTLAVQAGLGLRRMLATMSCSDA